jgi:hypothetical protein
MGTRGIFNAAALAPLDESFQGFGENLPTQYPLHHEKVCHITY